MESLVNGGLLPYKGKTYRIHAGWSAVPSIYVQVAGSNGWRKTPPHERRLKPTSPLYSKVLEAFREATR